MGNRAPPWRIKEQTDSERSKIGDYFRWFIEKLFLISVVSLFLWLLSHRLRKRKPPPADQRAKPPPSAIGQPTIESPTATYTHLNPFLLLIYVTFFVIAQLALDFVLNVLATRCPVDTPQRCFIALGVLFLALAIVLRVEFHRGRVPITRLSLSVIIGSAGIGASCLVGGIMWAIIATPSLSEPTPPVSPAPAAVARSTSISKPTGTLTPTLVPPTPTSVPPTATPSATSTETATSSATSTETATPTVNPTETATPTVNPTETATLTATPTEMATPTATPTETATPKVSPTETDTPTATPTPPDTVWSDVCVTQRMEITGIGMGDSSNTINPQTIPLTDPGSVNWLLAQVAGVSPMPESVTFTTDAPQSLTLTEPSQNSPNGYTFEANLQPTSQIIASVNDPQGNTSRGLILYSKRATAGKWTSVGKTTNVFVWKNTHTEVLTFPSLAETTDLYITAVAIDNDEDSRPLVLEATAGGVTNSVTETGPTHGEGLNIFGLMLSQVPAGTNQVIVTFRSPISNGDSSVWVGVNTSYLCPEPPTATPTNTPSVTPEPTVEPTEEPTPKPTEEPTMEPTEEPMPEPTEEPTATPTEVPTPIPVPPTETPVPEFTPTTVPAPPAATPMLTNSLSYQPRPRDFSRGRGLVRGEADWRAMGRPTNGRAAPLGGV